MLAASPPEVERAPRHRRAHGLEKLQVQAAAVAAVCVVYFGLSRSFLSWDPQAPIVFLPLGAYGQALGLVGMLCGLAAACAVLTLSARAEGALLAVLLGAGGLSLRSTAIQGLFWLRPDVPTGVFRGLILEVLLLAGGVVIAAAIIDILRALLGRLVPGWLWVSPLVGLTDEDRRRVAESAGAAGSASAFLSHGLLPVLVGYLGHLAARHVGDRKPPAKALLRGLGCLGLSLLLAVVLMLLLLRSADRGQILFALAVSFGVGVLIAHQVLPVGSSLAAWTAPFIAAVLAYALAAVAPLPPSPQGWTNIPLYARALPVDWLSAGGGGALLGYWISWRIHEIRILEKAGKRGQASTD